MSSPHPETTVQPAPESGQEYTDTTFDGTTIDGQELRDIRFEGCTFEKCTFTDVQLHYCTFTDCSFKKCTLAAPKLLNCGMRGVSFKNSKVIGVDWTQANVENKKVPTTLVFEGCTINYCNFFGLKLHGLIVKKCIAHEVGFSGADLTDSNFDGTDLKGSEFLQSNLTRADFRHAMNYLIDPTTAIVKGALFSLPEAVSLVRMLGVTAEWESEYANFASEDDDH